jgi:hypothetical protein
MGSESGKDFDASIQLVNSGVRLNQLMIKIQNNCATTDNNAQWGLALVIDVVVGL